MCHGSGVCHVRQSKNLTIKLGRVLTKVQTAENIKGLGNSFYIKSAIMHRLSINAIQSLPSIFGVDYTYNF